MNEQILRMIGGEEAYYPHALEKQFLRILHRIVELWGTPACTAYFEELLVNQRGEVRQGFPPEVAKELFRLSVIHDHLKPQEKQADIWEVVDPHNAGKDQRTIEQEDPHHRARTFMKVIEGGNCGAVQSMLIRGFESNLTDERGWTPLMVSAFNGSEPVAELLIQYGADVQARDNMGYCPIHWAAYNGCSNVIKLLLDHRADCNTQSQSGWTPLMQAAARGHLLAAGQLIACGADVNLGSFDGWTPLHKAASNGHFAIVKLLLTKHAAPDVRHEDGSTPLSLARKNHHDQIAALLEKSLA